MDLIYYEFVRISQRSEIIVFFCTIPDNYVIKHKTTNAHNVSDIHVIWQKISSISQIHHIHQFIFFIFQNEYWPLL